MVSSVVHLREDPAAVWVPRLPGPGGDKDDDVDVDDDEIYI